MVSSEIDFKVMLIDRLEHSYIFQFSSLVESTIGLDGFGKQFLLKKAPLI